MALFYAAQRPADRLGLARRADDDDVEVLVLAAQGRQQLQAVDVRKVDVSVLADLISRGVVPVLAPLTCDGAGHLLNTNADTIVSEAAKALATCFDVTLVYCFEKKGVLSDASDEESVIPLITKESYGALVAEGVVSGGMLPKLDNAFAALLAGVSEVRITRSDALGAGAGTSVRL